ncbi:hypothetical protein [Nocardioides houyundeii]|uniref:hypothetical protein n=1 Tax=Nocardioides houyundeii TaxID=2045452 RepID=UPI0019648DDB|nr:hypothetical protein [Nocardioides houyundeii]
MGSAAVRMIARSSEYAWARVVGLPAAVVSYQPATASGLMSRSCIEPNVGKMKRFSAYW